jgi:hypothetical protein
MDFVGELGTLKRFVFGLRHTNRSMSSILASRRIVVSEIAGTYKQDLYDLGANHRAPFHPEDAGFSTLRTGAFDFLVPEWADRYWEIEILETMDLGSHMLLWGVVVNHHEIKAPSEPLYHIHFLQYLYRKQQNCGYLRVS